MMLFFLGLALIIVYKAFDSLGWIWGTLTKLFAILTPFVVGFCIAFVLYGPVRWFESLLLKCKGRFMQKAARPFAVIITYTLALALLAGIVLLSIPLFRSVVDFARGLFDGTDLATKIKQFIPALSNFDFTAVLANAEKALEQHFTFDRIASYLGSVWKVTMSIVDVILAIIVSVYMLLGREPLVRAFKSILGLVFKPRTMSSLSDYGHRIAKIFYSYLYSQMWDALVVGTLATIGFVLRDAIFLPGEPIRFTIALAFGMLMGLLNIIPYFGAFIGVTAFSLITLIDTSFAEGFPPALFIAIYLLVMQQIDANIIQPRIMGDNMGIRPIYVLLGITVFGGMFGFWGVLLGAPFMAVVQLLLVDYIRLRDAKAKKKTESANDPPSE